uniref:Sulfur oxidation protein DsrS n=1 Tax=uncultured bacterium ws034A6 TaxID=1131824 RepID=I1X591_9BACT|nr:sulfur oxidation protein DsrS [uncultured bacterium ws034A6]
MELTPEDALRINVLLAGSLKAVRIDESSMTLYALSDKGEAQVRLNPNCRDEAYLRGVRETLSSHVLGSPGGYPVYLKRWTRMGQARDETLESLLLLGEPEAVVAVVNASGITDELASRAWWASQTAENARCMLQQELVVDGKMGPVLADFLVEFLPFEEEARNQIKSVRLVLQGDLVDPDLKMKLWERGKNRNAYHVGFLQALPDQLPDQRDANPAWVEMQGRLEKLVEGGNPFARQLCRLLSSAGQAWLAGARTVLKKPANQDVMVELLHAIADYSACLQTGNERRTDIDVIFSVVDELIDGRLQAPGDTESWLESMINAVPDALPKTRAMLFLSMLDEPVIDPVFSKTDAIGTVMRKKMQPVSEPIQEQIEILIT